MRWPVKFKDFLSQRLINTWSFIPLTLQRFFNSMTYNYNNDTSYTFKSTVVTYNVMEHVWKCLTTSVLSAINKSLSRFSLCQKKTHLVLLLRSHSVYIPLSWSLSCVCKPKLPFAPKLWRWRLLPQMINTPHRLHTSQIPCVGYYHRNSDLIHCLPF